MAKVRLELENAKGEKVVHEKMKVKGRAVRKAIQCSRKMYAKDADMGTQLDALIELAVEVFNDKKVTEDTILDGIESDELFNALNKVYMDILGIKEDDSTDEKKVSPEEAEENYFNLCRQLIENGWTLEDIEEADFEALIQIVCSEPKKEKSKEVDLKDFVKSI